MLTLTPAERALSRLDLAGVMAVMVRQSGKSWEAVGRECGWTPHFTNRVRDSRDGEYTPGAGRMLDFCMACGSWLYADWLRARGKAAGAVAAGEVEALDCAGLLGRTSALFKEVGEFGQQAHAAIEDGSLNAKDFRRLARELHDLLGLCLDILAKLEAA